MTVQFSHIMNGGYSAGYYSYKWAEVLDADAFSLFKKNGIFNQTTAQSFRDNVLSKGSSMSALDLSKLAGCDVSTDEPLKEAIAYVGHLVDELYNLTDELNK